MHSMAERDVCEVDERMLMFAAYVLLLLLYASRRHLISRRQVTFPFSIS
jgi:hypothetical protein